MEEDDLLSSIELLKDLRGKFISYLKVILFICLYS